ncbi:MAG: hypothetical protein JNJ55_08430 [Betaproteobacteria bacterium]|nr:hypothetical protein [Betaproteobacteria bacterium]
MISTRTAGVGLALIAVPVAIAAWLISTDPPPASNLLQVASNATIVEAQSAFAPVTKIEPAKQPVSNQKHAAKALKTECGIPSNATAGSPERQSCALIALDQICAANHDAFHIEAHLAETLATHPGNIGKGLGRFNLLNARTHDSWCDIPASDRPAAIALASTPKRHRSPDRAVSNMDYMRWLMSGSDGTVDPGGFERALQQRRELLGESTAKQTAISATKAKQGSGERAATQTAGLPSIITGWTNLTGYAHPVGRVNDLLVDNTGTTTTRTLWAGTDGGGIWKSTNGGTSWAPINDFSGSLSIGKILRSPRNANEMYASTNPYGSHGYSPFGILKSNDGGATWNQLPATSPAGNADWEYVTHMAIHPAGVGGFDVLLAATYTGVFQSSDSGATWSKIAAGFASYVGFHPNDGNRRAYTLNDGKFRITTDGVWANATVSTLLANGSGSYTKFAFAKSDTSILYAITTDSGGLTNVVRSADGGATWSLVPTPGTAFFHLSYLYFTGGIWVDPFNPNRIVVLEARAIATANATTATSTTGWVQANVYWVDFHGVTHDPQYDGTTNKIMYLMDDGGLYRYTDVDTLSGNANTPIGLGMTVSQLYDVGGRSPGPYAFGAQDVGIRFYRSTVSDPVLRWRLRTAGPGVGDGARVVADPTNPTTLYATTQYLNLHRTTDGGVNTALICQGITDVQCTTQAGNASFTPPILLDPNNANTLYAGAASLWRTTNATGTTPSWTAIHTGAGSVASAIAVAASDSNIVWVAYQNGRVYKSTDALSPTPTFTQVMGLPGGSVTRVFIDRVNPNKVFVGLGGFAPQRLQMTTNGGASWTFATGLPNAGVTAIEAHPAKPNWLYVGTSVGLFTSENGGMNWTGSNEGPANVQVSALNWYSEFGNTAELLVGTFGRGVWKATVTADNGFVLTVTKTGAGSGTVTSGPAGIACGTTCANSFAADAPVTLVASPSNGSAFTGWSGGGCSGTGTCTITMSAAQTVTATFALSEPFPAGCALPSGWTIPAGANAGWASATDRARTGTCSLKSGVIGNGSVSTPAKAQIQVTGNFAAGTLSFYYNVSSEQNWDCLRVIVDTIVRSEMGSNCTGSGGFGQSGNITAWNQISVPIAAGNRTIVWSFERDNTGAFGSDAAWIDDVTLPPLASSGSVQFASATAAVNEASNAVALTVNRTGGSSGAASVSYATANGSATAGSDYAATSGTLNWADGDVSNRTITIPIYKNAPAESAETFTVTLSNPAGALLGTPTVATVTIVEGALPPDAPTIGAAMPGNGEALIAFTPPAFNGGAAITGYTAACVAGMQNVTASGAGSPINVQGLSNGTLYACTVAATNAQGTGAASMAVNVTPDVNAPLVLLGAVSRMTHSGLGACDVPLDLTAAISGNVTIEPRLRHASHAVVFRFNNVVNAVGGASVADAASMTLGAATPGATGSREMPVSLSSNLDTKRATVTVTGLNGTLNAQVSLGFLAADFNATRLTSASDLAALKSRSGQSATSQNCRFDVDASGAINSTDISAAKARSGLSMP